MKKILIIEDDKQVREELKILLDKNGYEGIVTEEFADLPRTMLQSQADLILLDITLPHTDGETVLKQFRRESDVPVMMVTSRNTEIDEVLCMSYGADDFIAKPYNPAILLLHIEAILKRTGKRTELLTWENLKLDMAKGVFIVDGMEIELSKNEMKILGFLVKHQGRIVSRDELISYLWDTEEFVDDNTLTVNINRVRKKLEEVGLQDVIKTKRGQGYIIG